MKAAFSCCAVGLGQGVLKTTAATTAETRPPKVFLDKGPASILLPVQSSHSCCSVGVRVTESARDSMAPMQGARSSGGTIEQLQPLRVSVGKVGL